MHLKSVNMIQTKWLNMQLYALCYIIKGVFFLKKNHTFISNKILNMFSKIKINDNIHCFMFQII
jgi:hypothetical protein